MDGIAGSSKPSSEEPSKHQKTEDLAPSSKSSRRLSSSTVKLKRSYKFGEQLEFWTEKVSSHSSFSSSSPSFPLLADFCDLCLLSWRFVER